MAVHPGPYAGAGQRRPVRALVLVGALLALGSLPGVPAEIPAPPAAPRDVIAGAFRYPFLTDAEVVIHFDDTRARLSSAGGPTLFRYPEITAVVVDGARVPGERLGPDILRATLPAGTHEVRVLTAGPGAPAPPLARSPTLPLFSPDAFKARAAALKPGDELVVADGTYTNWQVEAAAQGTRGQPIIIRPQTPGGATLRRDSRIRLRGRFLVLKGFRFEQCGPGTAVHVIDSSDCRVTQCQFFNCGSPQTTFAHIAEVDMGTQRCRVDHCYFTGSKSMSLAQRISLRPGVELGTDNRFDHNIFRDIYRYWINGQENIQIGQNQRGASGAAEPRCTVEGDLFDHAWGDGEVISNKSSRNTIRWNTAAYCRRSAFTLRGGDGVRFEGNLIYRNADGLRVMGGHHVIVNNLILDQTDWGIYFETGSKDGESQVASEGSLVAHNTILNCAAGAIGAMATTEGRPHAPTGNSFVDNLLAGGSGTLLDASGLPGSKVLRNLFAAGGTGRTGETGENPVVVDGAAGPAQWAARALGQAVPLPEVTRDRLNRVRPAAGRDIGAEQEGAAAPAGEEVILPPLPKAPLLDPGLYRREVLFAQDARRPLQGWQAPAGAEARDGAMALKDASAALAAALPDDFVLQWEYQPGAFAAQASLAFAQGPAGGGYTLSWGGVGDDGKPTGVIALRKGGSDEVVADGADVVNYCQDFRYQGWTGGTRNTRTAPDPAQWYRFTLIKQGGRLFLLLGDARRKQEPGTPVLIWEDRGVVGGAVPSGPGLRVAQKGAGSWRGLTAWRYGYTGDTPPPAPKGLAAMAAGSGRVTLRWESAPGGCLYDVHRSMQQGFTPSLENSVAPGGVSGGSFDDFSVAPRTRYVYQVRAVNPLGLVSLYAPATVTTGSGGPAYRLIPASEARVVAAPMAWGSEARFGRICVFTASGSYMAGPPAQGGAELVLKIAKTGDYAVWGLVRAPDEGSDSFYTSLDAVEGGADRVWYTGIFTDWGWSKIAAPVRLTAGEHVLHLKPREPGTALAALLVTDDLAWGSGD